MRCLSSWNLFKGILVLFVVVWPGTTGYVRAQEGSDGTGEGSGSREPGAVEEAFFASFESEPAGLAPNLFSLTLGGEAFDFIFTDEGDDWGNRGFSHESGFGEGGSASIDLGSAVYNLLTTERVIIVSNDGEPFGFHSLFINNGSDMAVTVAGFNSDAQVGDAQVVASDSEGTLVFSGLVVDEVRLTSLHFENTNIDSFSGNTTTLLDFGDLPASYGMTSDVDDGARHPLGSVYLGSCVDAEEDGQPSSMADGDDTDGAGETEGLCATSHADEDGVAPGSLWQDGAGGGSLQVSVAGGAGCLSGWIDWDSDHSFTETGDQVFDMEPVGSGPNALTFNVPAGVFSGNDPQPTFFARFRLIADAGDSGDCADDPTLQAGGAGGEGEVEDYRWSFSPTAVEVSTVAVSEKTVPVTRQLAFLGLLLSIVTSAILMAKPALTSQAAAKWHVTQEATERNS